MHCFMYSVWERILLYTTRARSPTRFGAIRLASLAQKITPTSHVNHVTMSSRHQQQQYCGTCLLERSVCSTL